MKTSLKTFSAIFTFASLVFFSPIVSAQIPLGGQMGIYSKLKCCSCKDAFESCLCREAVEMKAFVAALAETGLPQEEILYKVAKKFTLNVIRDEETKGGIRQRIIKEAGPKRPEMVIEPSAFHFGQVSKKQGRISKVFRLFNRGGSPLVITNIRVLCNCVTASLKAGGVKSPAFGISGAPAGWQVVIEPGKFAELEVVLDLAHPSMEVGKETRDVLIAGNDPLAPEEKLTVDVDIVP